MSADTPKGSLFLVDAYALIFQAFHAIPAGMASPKGLPTAALYGFARDMLYLYQEKKPDYLVVAFDGDGPTFRDELYKEYKANRSAMPEDLRVQIPEIVKLVEAMNVPVLVGQGYEADDVIATVAAVGARRGLDVFICSSDKDCRQLIGDRVRMYSLRKQKVFDRDALLADWGVTPEQVVDLQTLVGDPVDNVPGVPGLGVKTAAKLLQEYGTLDNLLEHIDEVSGPKRRENLRAAAATLETTRRLVTLATDLPLKFDWPAWQRRPVDAPRLLALFREWGFHRFADQVRALAGGQADADAGAEEELPLFRQGGGGKAKTAAPAAPKKASAWQATYHLVDTPEAFDRLVEKLSSSPRFVVDLETVSNNPGQPRLVDPLQADVVGFAFAVGPGEAWYVPVRGPAGSRTLPPEATLDRLRPIFENEKIAKLNQNIKYDMLVLRQQGVHLRGVCGDPMVADYLLNAGEKSHNIETLARHYLQHDVIPITDLIGKKGPAQKNMDGVPTDRVAEYAGEDADVAWRLGERLDGLLAGAGLRGLYETLEVPLIGVLAEIESNGVRLDVPLLEQLGRQLGGQLADIEKEIYRIAEEEFNIASLKQLRRVLFDKLKLPVRKKTDKGEPSTDQETLEWLAAEKGHGLPKLLLEQRRLSKLKGTYIDTLPALVNPRTGRVHASFHQTVVATGRLSSSDPNLQNIPIRSELGGQIRQAFVPEPGWVLLTADYSQVELRLLAHFSGDAVLRRAFEEDRDVHTLVAAQIYGVPEGGVTAEMRRMAKTVNFGVIYGMSAYGLAQRLQIPKDQANAFIEAYFARYPDVLAYQSGVLRRCRESGYVATILGRRRAFQRELIRPDSDYHQRNQAEREAINMEIQGSAADLIKVAMVNIHRRLRGEGWRTRMLLQIHDELVFEAPPEEADKAGRMIAAEMTGALAPSLQVKLKVDLGRGPNWLDTEEVKL